jgi:hypothetical protein
MQITAHGDNNHHGKTLTHMVFRNSCLELNQEVIKKYAKVGEAPRKGYSDHYGSGFLMLKFWERW